MLTDPNSVSFDLDPSGRSYALREAYWQKVPQSYLTTGVVAGCGEDTLVGHARDFAAKLEASPAAIPPRDLLAGVALIRPEEDSTLNLGHYDGHYPPGHAKLIRCGLTGIRDRAQEKLETATDPDQRDFLEGVVIAYEAALQCVARHADHALEMAEEETDPTRQEELERMAAVCRQLTAGPPESFQAGLQLIWFTFMFGGSGCIGRFDHWMLPLYQRDLETGRLTWEQAQELLENYWIKLNYFAGNNDSLRNIALAGQTPTGEDACNDLSYMALIATARLRLPEPKLNVRFFSGTPGEL